MFKYGIEINTKVSVYEIYKWECKNKYIKYIYKRDVY